MAADSEANSDTLFPSCRRLALGFPALALSGCATMRVPEFVVQKALALGNEDGNPANREHHEEHLDEMSRSRGDPRGNLRGPTTV